MPRLALSLLGPFQARVGERAVVHFATDKARALLAYLALEADRPHRRDTLAALLWPEWDDAGARSNLRLALHRLRESLDSTEPTLSDGIFGVTRETVQINRMAVDVDVARFVALLEMCELHPHRLLHLCPSCLAQLDEAAALYEGELLAGLSIGDAPGFEQWELARRAEMEQRVLTLFYRLADAFEQLGDYERGLFFAHRQLAIDPYREEAHRQVMHLYARRGERAAALAHFERARRLLADELGVAPAPATVALAEEVRQGTLTTNHISRPQRYHFPAQFTPFFGRAEEINRLVRRLSSAECRLLTVIAPGGMGKTRLAIAAAEALAERPGFPDGIYYLPLARIATADLLPSALAGALGLVLSGATDPAEQLGRYLHPRRALVVLDNFEHLLDGLDLIIRLLEEAPDVHWLITSRVALNIRAEERFTIGGLEPEAARELFISVASRIVSGYEPDGAERMAIADIGVVVGGMPLAVELAATWVRLMDAPSIMAHMRRDLDFLTSDMRDLPQRQRSMRIVLDQLWDKLPPEEAETLAMLSVLRGGFRLDAADAVSEARPAILAALIDQSLVRAVGSGRFEIHELLRQYAAQRLAAAPDLEVTARARHAAHYLALLEQRGAALGGPESREALASLRRNLDNVRLAWQWAVDGRRIDELGHAARPLERLYHYSGLLAEGAQTFAAAAAALAVGLDRGDLDPATAQPLLYDLWRREAHLLLLRADLDGALARLEQVRAGWEALGDRRRLAQTLNHMAHAHRRRAGAPGAELAQAALALGRELDDNEVIADALHSLGNVAETKLELGRAEALLRESIALYQTSGGRRLAGALGDLGRVLLYQGRHDEARAAMIQGLTIAEEAGDRPGIAFALTALGGVAVNTGDLEAAEKYSRSGLSSAQEIGESLLASICLVNLSHAAAVRGDPAARLLYRDTLAYTLEAAALGTMSEALIGLASLAVHVEPLGGTRWLMAAVAWRRTLENDVEEPFVRALQRETEAQLRAALDEETFAAAWAEGEATTLETAAAQAIAWAAEMEYRV